MGDPRTYVRSLQDDDGSLSRFNFLKDEVPQDDRKIVLNIIDDIFEQKRGVADISSSSYCASKPIVDKPQPMDRRLAYWRQVLDDRKKIQSRIQKNCGKRPDQIMFNRMTTVDERNKKTVQTLIDYAYRLTPTTVLNRKPLKLKSYPHAETCGCTAELAETLPKAERDRCKFVEISGLPNRIKEEMLGKPKEQGEERKGIWLHSEVLKHRIQERRVDLERVIEFYPDIDKLEVVGEGVFPPKKPHHDSKINLIHELPIKHISSDTTSVQVPTEEVSPVIENVPEFALKINEQTFTLTEKASKKMIEAKTFFQADPYEKAMRIVLHLENIGRKVINFEWVNRFYYEKNGKFLKALDGEFKFNSVPFRLFAGESRDVIVTFQPRMIGMYKDKWLLKIDPHFFCKRADAVAIKFAGHCTPPIEYVTKINQEQQIVLEKSNMAMMRKFTSTIASITPLLKPPERVCPYQRILEDREIFELENIGFKCDRFQDLELLKAIYEKVKRPREHAWDLRLDTLKNMILRLEGADQRALVLDEMLGIVQSMRGQPLTLDEKLQDKKEKNKTCLIHVKGLMCAAIDDWEDILGNIENGFFQPVLDNFSAEIAEMDLIGAEEMEEDEGDYKIDLYLRLLEAGDAAIANYITKKVRRSKVFRDAALIQTYTLLCNVIEDIVSVVESTDVI